MIGKRDRHDQSPLRFDRSGFYADDAQFMRTVRLSRRVELEGLIRLDALYAPAINEQFKLCNLRSARRFRTGLDGNFALQFVVGFNPCSADLRNLRPRPAQRVANDQELKRSVDRLIDGLCHRAAASVMDK